MTTNKGSIQKVEECAQEVLQVWQTCVDTIRSTTMAPSSATRSTPVLPHLYTIMTDKEILKNVGRVGDCVNKQATKALDNDSDCSDADSRTNRCWNDLSRELVCSLNLQNDSDSHSGSTANARERTKLVYEICLPLILSLGQCYSVLDHTTTEPVAPSPTNNQKTRPKKPPPPPGMLSLQQYTDVAALLEFVVCTSILPLMDDHILATAEQRAKMLAKSIAGRLPRKSLLWGTECNKDSKIRSVDKSRELQLVSVAIGNLLLLDRFRPMLLPRHLADLYAAIFQSEHYASDSSSEQSGLSCTFQHFRSIVLPTIQERARGCPVDAMQRVRAYQTLLLRGTASPLWLQQRVSSLLTETAAFEDLSAVVQVFVVAAADTQQTDPSAASLRLARAIIADDVKSPSNTNKRYKYHQALCRQITTILDVIANANESIECLQARGLDVVHTCYLTSIWALVDLLPLSILEETFLGPVKEWNGEAETDAVHRCILRFGVLLSSSVPPFVRSSRFCRLMLKSIQPKGQSRNEGVPLNLLGLLLSLTSLSSVLVSKIRLDAIWTLRLCLHELCRANFSKPGRQTSVSGSTICAMALVYAIAPSPWDMAYKRLSDGTPSESGVSRVNLVMEPDKGLGYVVDRIEARSKSLVKDILNPLIQHLTKNGSNDSGTAACKSLVPTILSILMETYFTKSISEKETDDDAINLFEQNAFALVPLVALPILCENCPLEYLLNENGALILPMMNLVFCATTERLGIANDREKPELPLMWRKTKIEAASLLHDLLDSPTSTTSQTSASPAEDDFIISICAVMLSLLVAILELGSDSRPQEDELILQSFKKTLTPLAQLQDGGDRESLVPSEITQMASHAVALLSARGASFQENTPSGDSEDITMARENTVDMVSRLEDDLASSEPPIRARAMVSLTHLVSSYCHRESTAENANIGSLLLTEDQKIYDEFWRLLLLAVRALEDSESYVFLAAIQAVATCADVDSPRVLNMLAMALSCGTLCCPDSIIPLSEEQRTKLAEAIISFIRRKASVNEFLPDLVDILMCYGESSVATNGTMEEARKIQLQTHDYFERGFGRWEEDNELSSQEERWEALDTRAATGGPLFTSESPDVVRASRISILSELVLSVEPALVARYCDILVLCALNTIRLETSRPMRRAGALLAKALYDALVREQDAFLEDVNNGDEECRFAAAMVAAQEDLLAIALERCLEVGDLGDLPEGKQRQYDPATVARCQEALSLRKTASEGGILAAGSLLLQSHRQDNSSLRRTLLEPSREVTETKIKASKSLIKEIE